MKNVFEKKLEERENKSYHVNFKIDSNIINANITLIESVTNNEVYAVCYPLCTKVISIKIDGVEYDLEGFIDEIKIRNLQTNKLVRSKFEVEYLKAVANQMIRKGNEYLKNTFGNIDKEIVEIY